MGRGGHYVGQGAGTRGDHIGLQGSRVLRQLLLCCWLLLLMSKHRSASRENLVLLSLELCKVSLVLWRLHSLLFNQRNLLSQDFVLLIKYQYYESGKVLQIIHTCCIVGLSSIVCIFWTMI